MQSKLLIGAFNQLISSPEPSLDEGLFLGNQVKIYLSNLKMGQVRVGVNV